MIKLRLWGTVEELEAATDGLVPGARCTLTATVLSVSAPAADRGQSVLYRVYVDADQVTSAPASAAAAAAPAAPTPPPARRRRRASGAGA